jgi:hypothetical protein
MPKEYKSIKLSVKGSNLAHKRSKQTKIPLVNIIEWYESKLKELTPKDIKVFAGEKK